MSAVLPGYIRRRMIVEETRALPQDTDSRNPEHDQQSGIDSSLSALIQNLSVVHPSADGHPPVHSFSSEQLDSDTELKHDHQSRQSSDTTTIVGPSSEPRPVQAAGTRTERPPAADSRPSGRPRKFDFSATTVTDQRSPISNTMAPTRQEQRTAAPPAEQSAAFAFPPECEPAGGGAVYDFTRTNNSKGS